MTNFTFDLYFSFPEIYLLIAIVLLLIYGVLNEGSKTLGYPLISQSIGYLSLQILIFTLCFLLKFPYLNIYIWNFLLVSNLYVLYSKIFLILSSIIWIIFSFNYLIRWKLNSFEYWIIILLTLLAFCLLLQVSDLLSMYLLIELQSLSFYILASFKRSSEFSTEAGLKYFILGAFSSGFLLFGSSIVYGLTGLTSLGDLTILFSGFLLENSFNLFGVFSGLVFIISALFFKLSASPFHMWSPDVYEGSPTSTTAFFSIFPKLVIFTLLLRIFSITFHDFINFWKYFFIVSAFLSLVFGTFGALSQIRWKRFFAFSSINHVGFILIGFTSGELLGTFSILMYLLIYIITMFTVFSFLTDLQIYKYPKVLQVRYIKDITSLGKNNILLSLSLSLILFSMAGIPPLSGFFAKVFIILSGLQGGLYSLIIFSIIMSSISCFYYIRIIQNIYFIKVKKWPLFIPISKCNSLILGLFSFIICFYFLDIELFSILITRITLTFM